MKRDFKNSILDKNFYDFVTELHTRALEQDCKGHPGIAESLRSLIMSLTNDYTEAQHLKLTPQNLKEKE